MGTDTEEGRGTKNTPLVMPCISLQSAMGMLDALFARCLDACTDASCAAYERCTEDMMDMIGAAMDVVRECMGAYERVKEAGI